MSPFSIQEIQDSYPYSTQVVGHWTSTTAGGSLNHPSFQLNPRYKLTALKRTRIFITLEAPKEYAVNVKLIRDDVTLTTEMTSKVRYGHQVVGIKLEIETVVFIPAGIYTVVPSTFQPGQIGTFILTVQSTEQLSFS
ncbi:hypothetical protein SpCBS45565_g05885 [Spizellomyces sp. 'palustris']|nr:hypothetical protein SpCBS45565_g05885 [Spizellomyces sp. 'palustris']